MLLGLSVGFFAWVFLSGGWTRVERNHLILIGVLFVGYALVRLVVRAGRFNAEPVRGPQYQQHDLRLEFSEQLVPVGQCACSSSSSRRCLPGCGSDWRRAEKSPGRRSSSRSAFCSSALGFAVLIPPADAAEGGALVSPGWLILTYLLHTWGELALSPVGLSAMSKLAPVRIGGLVMGVWFLGTSVGNYFGGRAAGFYESMTLPNLFIAVDRVHGGRRLHLPRLLASAEQAGPRHRVVAAHGARGIPEEAQFQQDAGTGRASPGSRQARGARALLLRPETSRQSPSLRLPSRTQRRPAVVGRAERPVARSRSRSGSR